MTTTKERERDEAVQELKKILRPGDTVYTVLRRVSSSGMSRQIDVYVIRDNKPHYLTGLVAKATGQSRADQGTGPLKVGGAGMDMGFAVVYGLSRRVFHDGFKCTGKDSGERRCPSNDHSNDYGDFSRRYGEEHDPEAKLRYRDEAYAAAKRAAWEAGAADLYSKRRVHSDPGYALRQQWL